MMATPVAPPHNSALTHNTGNTGQIAANTPPKLEANTLNMTGRFKPCLSAYLPEGKARNTWVSANSASNTPTVAAL